jgi:hypothetical protein
LHSHLIVRKDCLSRLSPSVAEAFKADLLPIIEVHAGGLLGSTFRVLLRSC